MIRNCSVKITDVLDPHFCNLFNINESQSFTVEWVEPNVLIVPQRLDLIPKILYAQDILSCKNDPYIEELYDAHIYALTNGTCTEEGKESYKNSIQAFRRVFRELVFEIRDNGINSEKSVVPLSRDNIIFDGAHRVAACIALGIDVPVVRINNAGFRMGADFLRKHYLDSCYIDYILYKYSLFKETTLKVYLNDSGIANQELNLSNSSIVEDKFIRCSNEFNSYLYSVSPFNNSIPPKIRILLIDRNIHSNIIDDKERTFMLYGKKASEALFQLYINPYKMSIASNLIHKFILFIRRQINHYIYVSKKKLRGSVLLKKCKIVCQYILKVK